MHGGAVANEATQIADAAEEASRRGDWTTALEYWESCLREFAGDARMPLWLGRRAAALIHLGRLAEGEAAYRSFVAAYPTRRTGYAGLAWLAKRLQNWSAFIPLVEDCLVRFPDDPAARAWREMRAIALENCGARREAAAAWDELIASYPGTFHLDWRVRSATCRDDLTAARMAVRDALVAAQTPAQLEQVFAQVPAVFEGWERTSIWIDIGQRLQAMASEPRGLNSGRAAELRMRLKLALRDYDGFLACIDLIPANGEGDAMVEYRDLARRLRLGNFPDFGAEKIFVIGFSRTGTKSIYRALNQLGFHMAHFTNGFTGEILTLEDAFLFDGLADAPACVMFETLYYMFPNAKFILTVRPLDRWLVSFTRHAQRSGRPSAFDESRDRLTQRGAGAFGTARALLLGALLYNHPNAAAAREHHDARVRAFFERADRGRLLQFDLFSGDGWEKLCDFVGRPVPPGPFPWENRAVDHPP